MKFMSFTQSLIDAWRHTDSLLCIGLDPEPIRFPPLFAGRTDAIFDFCCAIVDATAAYACAFKPQIAYFAANRAEDQLEQLIAYIHQQYPGRSVILDAKRGDIDCTAEQYAREAFERYRADAVTVNPYLGFDTLQPYFAYPNKGVIVLCRTSNPGSTELQCLQVNGQPLYQRIALHIATQAAQWRVSDQVGLVMGATFPDEIAVIRRLVGETPLLIPGIGTQGGNIAATVTAGRTSTGTGMLLNSARAILYASRNDDFAAAAAKVAQNIRDEINLYRQTNYLK